MTVQPPGERPVTCGGVGAEVSALYTLADRLQAFAGTLSADAGQLLACLRTLEEIDRRSGRLSALRGADSPSDLRSRIRDAYAFFVPELRALPPELLERLHEAEPQLQGYRRLLDRLRRR